jgi:DNA-binding NarL/FixJ family response regulator
MLPAIQIIMVTVYEDTERISAALRAGACGYLLKRCTPAELVAAIREARMGGVPMPREIARKVIASFQHRSRLRRGWRNSGPANGKFLSCWPRAWPTRRLPTGWG